MMTIKEFAQLCSCNAQTLRYYDKIDLLKPVKVDSWSGYRYYEPAQAVDFVKIKNLQAADFTIEEIKTLLALPDQQVYEAFERKIAEQTQKLERIREIQQSYLTEKTVIEKIVNSLSDYFLRNCTNLEPLKEFGLTTEDAPEVLVRLRTYLNQWIAPNADPDCDWSDVTLQVNGEYFHGEDQVLERISALTSENLFDTICLSNLSVDQDSDSDFDPNNHVSLWERHGWDHISQFIDEIPVPEAGGEYCFWVRLSGEQYKGDPSYSMFLLGAMLLKWDLTHIPLSVVCKRSADSDNHFALLVKSRTYNVPQTN